jgi:hypothetical protein
MRMSRENKLDFGLFFRFEYGKAEIIVAASHGPAGGILQLAGNLPAEGGDPGAEVERRNAWTATGLNEFVALTINRLYNGYRSKRLPSLIQSRRCQSER